MLIATYLSLLRAVNANGSGKLPMDQLRGLCGACGFAHVRTFVASGAMIFGAQASEAEVQVQPKSALQG